LSRPPSRHKTPAIADNLEVKNPTNYDNFIPIKDMYEKFKIDEDLDNKFNDFQLQKRTNSIDYEPK
jgi:hypothetical protein